MALTFGDAKKALSPFAGVAGYCPDAREIELFVRKVLEYMLVSGAHGDERKFCFCAVQGCFTLPPELDVPLKVRIDGAIGNVWSKHFEFHAYGEEIGCEPAQNAMYEEADSYATAYEIIPGSRVATLGIVDESEDAHIIVSGVDPSGREVLTQHMGEQISGEYLSIQKGKRILSQASFAKITAINKTKTNGYVSLYGVNEFTGAKQFLSDYTPYEQLPQYRRFRIKTKCHEFTKLTVLGRIKLKEFYADTDIIPFSNLYALDLAAQSMQSMRNDNVEVGAAKDQLLTNVINKENSSKQVNNGQPIEMWHPLSMGSLRGII